MGKAVTALGTRLATQLLKKLTSGAQRPYAEVSNEP
jgi:hypothetical protein